jgi:hypothetical protein
LDARNEVMEIEGDDVMEMPGPERQPLTDVPSFVRGKINT